MLADCDGMLCCSTQINQCKCVLSTLVKLEHMPLHHFETQFQFSILIVQLKSSNQLI